MNFTRTVYIGLVSKKDITEIWRMFMKKIFLTVMGVITTTFLLGGCGSSSSGEFAVDNDITTISREEGSGTRDAFVSLFGIQEKDADGNTVDNTTSEASITNNTSVMMTTVAGDQYSIGYISLGVLDDSVKALKINGVEATAENVKDGSYEVSRPFIIATKDGLSDVAEDFIKYILTSDGQAVVQEAGYIESVDDAAEYVSSNLSGKIVVAGSSSVSPVMEKLKEAYLELNPNITIEIQTSDSTTGISSTVEGICDIGMSSRDLKDSEIANGVTSTEIAIDGIAVVINNDNPIDDLTSDQIKDIYTGNILSWSEVE